MRSGIVVLAMITIIGTTVQAAEVFISMARDRWPGDQRIEFSLFSNPEESVDASTIVLPDHVVCNLESGGRLHSIVARRITDTETAETEDRIGGEKARYGFDPPTGIRGRVRMRINEIGVPAIQFDIGEPIGETLPGAAAPTLDSLFTLYQPYLGNIGAYQPMYFLVGAHPDKSKFQISFNYRLFNTESELTTRHDWIKGFHFGYTQTSFWDLGSSSAPFDDTSYKPELFWVSKNTFSDGSFVKGLFFQTGFQHESNGRGGGDSRSTNFLYLQPLFIFFSDNNHYGLQIAPRIWTYVNNDNETNPDLDRYRGYFDLEAKFGKMDGFVLGTGFRWAAEGASVQLDLTYPLHRFFFNTLDIYLQAQYVNVLSESLIDYQDRTDAFRLGISVVR